MKNAVAFIGDSITVGLATSNAAEKSENFGMDGDTIDGLLLRIPRYRLTGARAIVVEIGINNYKKDKLKNFGTKYDQLLRLLPQTTPVIAMAIMPVNKHADWIFPSTEASEAIRTTNRDVAATCKRFPNCRFLDLTSVLSDEVGDLQFKYEEGDGIHPTALAYEIWTEALRPLIPKAMY